MSTRERLTWGGDKTAAPLPVETADAKRASAHPAIPDEGITHPAGYDDPVQPNAYENGDTSSWAEDVHPGPYENSAHPATPDEGPFHPAAKQAARELRAAVERKAAKCIRIATAMMGKDVTLRDMEKQALSMMELDDNYINSTFARLAKKGEDEEDEGKEASAHVAGDDEDEDEGSDKEASARLAAEDSLLRRLLAEEDMDDDEDAGSDKEATDRFAGIESALATMSKELQAMRGGYAMDEPEVAMDEDEAMLANLLAEEEAPVEAQDEDEMLLSTMLDEEMVSEDDEAEALLAEMMEEEMSVDVPMPVMAAEEEDEGEGTDKEATLADYIGDAEMNISLTAGDDPMGLAGAVAGDDVLTNLYKSAADDDEDEESDDSDDDSEDEAEESDDDSEDEGDKEGKKASARKPRPKKASQGARTIGQPSFDKTASGEINDLERLWKSAPDVSDVF